MSDHDEAEYFQFCRGHDIGLVHSAVYIGRFDAIPGSILAHSSHVKGSGEYDPASAIETPRINVTLALWMTNCRALNLSGTVLRGPKWRR